jgi:hypothetical protein
MAPHDDAFPTASRSTIDPDLHEERSTSVIRRWVFGAILVLDLLAILAFVSVVVVPRLT